MAFNFLDFLTKPGALDNLFGAKAANAGNMLSSAGNPPQGANMLTNGMPPLETRPDPKNYPVTTLQPPMKPGDNTPIASSGLTARAGDSADAKPKSAFDQFRAFGQSDFGQNLNDMFTGWAMGGTPQQSLAMGAAQMSSGRKDRKGRNETMEWLKSRGMDETSAKQLIASPTALGSYLQDFMKQKTPEYQADLDYRRAATDALRNKAENGDQENFFGNPVPFQRQDGSYGYGQIGNRGGFKEIDIGQGNKFAPNTRTTDTGTELLTIGPGGEILAREAKNNRQAASDTAQGKIEGETTGNAAAGLPQALADADRSIELIDGMINHPGRATATGLSSRFDPRNYIAGTDATNFNVRKEQLQGQAFLQAFNSLKGGGQITEIEGKKATDAIARLNTAQSDDEYLKSLGELKEILAAGKQRAMQKAGVPTMQGSPSSLPPANAGSSDPMRLR